MVVLTRTKPSLTTSALVYEYVDISKGASNVLLQTVKTSKPLVFSYCYHSRILMYILYYNRIKLIPRITSKLQATHEKNYSYEDSKLNLSYTTGHSRYLIGMTGVGNYKVFDPIIQSTEKSLFI